MRNNHSITAKKYNQCSGINKKKVGLFENTEDRLSVTFKFQSIVSNNSNNKISLICDSDYIASAEIYIPDQ